jgi:hypothetical protein
MVRDCGPDARTLLERAGALRRLIRPVDHAGSPVIARRSTGSP